MRATVSAHFLLRHDLLRSLLTENAQDCSNVAFATSRFPHMKALSFRQLTKTYKNGVQALKGIDLDVEEGDFFALLGPNGAGKSTLLRAVAGLMMIDAGRIELDGDSLDAPDRGLFVPPQRRRIGVVFQDHRLFPHLRTVDNVAFGLRAQGMSRSAARRAARDWLDRLGIGDLAQRHPRQLSGGQAQRVALARSLAGRPRALLLDEPLAALDVQTRAEVQGELREHLHEFDGASVLVTHDPIEALLLATRIVVLEDGRVVQQGAPGEITSRPVTPYVARLVGMNLYAGRASGGRVELDGGGTLHVAGTPDGRVLVALRPSALTVHTEEPHGSSARNIWDATVLSLAPLADRIRLTVAGDQSVFVDVTASAVTELGLIPGRRIWLTAKATDVSAYPAPVAG
jgi:molybdate transport system ATP-binding protein